MVNQLWIIHRNQILVKVMYSLIILVTSWEFISNYSYYIMYSTPSIDIHNSFEQIINYGMAIVVSFNIILIFYNAKINHRFRNLRTSRSIEQPLILYMICLPMVVIAILGKLFLIIDKTAYWTPDNLDDVVCYVSLIIEYVALIALLLDISGYKNTGEEWFMNYINSLTLSLTIVCLFMEVCQCVAQYSNWRQ